jgi:hypothetical protein
VTDRSRNEELGGGGMTGATGDLVPDSSDEAFVPGERRETSGTEAQASVTHHQAAAAPAQLGDVGDPSEQRHGGPTNLAERESGYGSEHGLAPDDPAYRMEIHPPADVVDDERDARQRETRIGGDELTDADERF